jgi:DNA-binding transcriptional regulator YiaG
MTIYAAAGLMGVAHGALENWEKSASQPSTANRKRLEAFLARTI